MKKKHKAVKIVGIVVGVILLLAILVIGILLIYRQVKRSSIRKEQAITSEQGIDEDRVIEINGIKQFINIRGENKNNPVILVLHGGPGSPISPMRYTYQKGLEEQYTVVNWDQRNAGKTYFLNEENQEIGRAS